MTPDKRIVDIIFIYVYIQKSVESVLSLVPRIEGRALPDKSKRAAPKAPRRCKYIVYITDNNRKAD